MAKKPPQTASKFNLRDAKVLAREDLAVEDGQPKRVRLRKEVVRVGVYHKAGGVSIPITRERLDHWANQFNRMKSSKVAVPVTSDHSLKAKDKRGDVLGLTTDGDSLYADCEIIGQDAIDEALRNQCSIGINDVTGGDGSEFSDAIEHIALTPVPVVGGLGDWQRLSRSIPKDTAEYMSNGDDQMEVYKRICKLLGVSITDDMTEEQIVAAIEAWAEQNKEGAGKGAAAGATARGGSPAGSGGGSPGGGAGPGGGGGMSREVETLKAQLSKLTPPEIDEDALEMAAEAKLSRLDALIPAGKVTKAVRDKLAPLMVGEPGNRPAMSLSRKAATFAGLAEPLADTILAALELNDPAKCGEATRHKGREMSREVPGGGQEDNSAALIEAEIKKNHAQYAEAR